MPTDTMTLVGLGVGAVVVIWLVFSVVRKMLGILIVIGLAVGAWMVWNDPELQAWLTQQLQSVFG
jgi:uncharacterized membrane protein YccC